MRTIGSSVPGSPSVAASVYSARSVLLRTTRTW